MNSLEIHNQQSPQAYRARKLLVATAIVAAITAAAFGLRQAEVVFAGQTPPVDAALNSTANIGLGFADVVEAVSPAVVAIRIKIQAVNDLNQGGQGENSPPWNFRNQPFEEFFKGPFFDRFKNMPDMRKFRRPNRHPTASIGSGVIFDPQGYVATNAHVVDNAEIITITLQDGTSIDAKVIGVDEFTDLAVLELDSDRTFPYARFGNSDSVRVGDLAIALGNPFGLQHSASLGIISAKHRDNIMSESNVPLIQTDAAINRGNSGGPLFNISGEIVGINSMIFSPRGANSGIGFAIPSQLVEEVASQLIAHGSIQRGRLGVVIQNLTDEMADALGIDSTDGALVASVDEASTAAKAGVEVGDVIVAFEGSRIGDVKQLALEVRSTRPGSDVEIQVLRNGELVDLRATLGEIAPQQVALRQDQDEPTAADQPKIGVQLASIDGEQRAKFGIDPDVDGVVVVQVEPGSTADEAGLRPGDVIISVGNQSVESPKHVVESIRAAASDDKEHLLMLIGRGADQRFLAVALS